MCIAEEVERRYIARLGIPPGMEQYKRWIHILDKSPSLRACIQLQMGTDDTKKVANM